MAVKAVRAGRRAAPPARRPRRAPARRAAAERGGARHRLRRQPRDRARGAARARDAEPDPHLEGRRRRLVRDAPQRQRRLRVRPVEHLAARRRRRRHARGAARGARAARGSGGEAGGRAADRGGARAAPGRDPGRAAAARGPAAVRLQPGLPSRGDRRVPQRPARDRGAAGLRRAAAEPRPLEARARASTGRSTSTTARSRLRSRPATRTPPAARCTTISSTCGRTTSGPGAARGDRVRHPGKRPARRRRPGSRRLPRGGGACGGARLRLDLGRRPHLLPEPDPGRRRRAVDVRGRHDADHGRCGHRAAAPAPPVCGREGVRVARLRLRRPDDPRSGRRRRERGGLRRGRGIDPRERGARTDDAMRALRALFSGGRRPTRGGSSRSRDLDRAAAGAARRPAALGRGPLGGGDPASGDARRRLDPDLGVGGGDR